MALGVIVIYIPGESLLNGRKNRKFVGGNSSS